MYAHCSGTGGQPTAVSLLVIMVATRMFCSQRATGLETRLPGGLLDLAPALDLLVRMDTSAVESSFGTVQTLRFHLRAGQLPGLCLLQRLCLQQPDLQALHPALPLQFQHQCQRQRQHQCQHRCQQSHHVGVALASIQVHVFGPMVCATPFQNRYARQLRGLSGVAMLLQLQPLPRRAQQAPQRLIQWRSPASFVLRRALCLVLVLKSARRLAGCFRKEFGRAALMGLVTAPRASCCLARAGERSCEAMCRNT